MSAMRLARAELKRIEDLVDRLTGAERMLDEAITEFNEELKALKEDKLLPKIETYNQVLRDAREFAEDIASRLDDKISERSESWQESEKGEAAIAFKESWETIGYELEEIDLELPEDIEMPELGHAEVLQEAPTEPE
jgi:uncharacterized protein YukE